jgi:hypothetical protein
MHEVLPSPREREDAGRQMGEVTRRTCKPHEHELQARARYYVATNFLITFP